MKRINRKLAGFTVGLCLVAGMVSKDAWATPSTHVWTPSTDIQANGTGHLTADMYVPSETDSSGSKPNTVTNLGLESGVWPIKDKLGIEFGFDAINGYGELDNYPLYFNAKVATTEDALFEYAPAIAFGGYNFGTEHDKTNLNIFYLEGARTLKIGDLSLGRFSTGWFWGNDKLLVDNDGDADDNGVILSWERTMSEISDKLWICMDYQGSNSGMGAMAPGFSWKFADNTALLFGYVIPNNHDLAETFTVQVDVDFNIW